MLENVFETSFFSDTYRVRQVVNGVLDFICQHHPAVSTEDLSDVKLMLSELLFNAVIHGNQMDTNKRINVYVELKEDALYASISDEGPGFDHVALLSQFEYEQNLTGESGRGIRLVYALADDMAFNGTGNEIKFYKRMATHG